MQVLEKILEEIEEGAHTFELLGREVDFVAIDWVRDIIRKHMNDNNEIVEQCPHCENEAALHWDVEEDGYEAYCPYCGKPMMLCSMCDARDGAVCDWEKEKGCKHSKEIYCTNDGWIPVERELPPNAKHKGSFCPKVRVMTKFGETYGWYNPDRESWYVLAWFMTDRYLDSEIDFDRGDKPKIVRLPDEVNDKTHILIAWRPLPEAYLPERSDNHEGE